jgi:exosortase
MNTHTSFFDFSKRHEIVQVFVLVSSFIILYSHTVLEMIKNWNRDDNFSHGFLIPVISAFMIWKKRHLLAQQKMDPSAWGVVFILCAMCMHIVGAISGEVFTIRTSLIVCIIGTVIFLFGFRTFLLICIPVLYLFFMIPIPKIIWNQISFPLQILAAKLASSVIQLLGIAILREGNVLHLSNTTLEVVDACSGLRSLTSLLALSAAFAYLTSLRMISRMSLFLSAIPIAVVVNIMRLTTTAVLAMYIGPEAANGFLHDISGILVFIIACSLLYGLQNVLSRIEKQPNKDLSLDL